jgi:hypothetical protein
MEKEQQCMQVIGSVDFKIVRKIKRLVRTMQTAEISTSSGISMARAKSIENLCIKMLNLGYACANGNIRVISGLEQISEKSILEKLLNLRGRQLIIPGPKKPAEAIVDSNLEKYRRRGRHLTTSGPAGLKSFSMEFRKASDPRGENLEAHPGEQSIDFSFGGDRAHKNRLRNEEPVLDSPVLKSRRREQELDSDIQPNYVNESSPSDSNRTPLVGRIDISDEKGVKMRTKLRPAFNLT